MKLARIVATLVGTWLAFLFVLGFVLSRRTADRVASRFASSLHATATIGDSSLGLVLGNFSFEKLVIRRDDVIGTLAIDVGEVHSDLAPLGIAFVDRSCGDLEIRDVELELSTVALFKLQRPKRTPFTAERVVIDNANLVFSPSAFLPGLGEIRIAIEHAEAGPTTFKTPLSWLYALEQLRARFELPAGITLRLTFDRGKLTAVGSVFGSTPVELPLALPKLDDADDAQAEIKKLVAFGKDLAEKLVAQKAEDLLKKLPIP